jgi:Uma2 family endonuclease
MTPIETAPELRTDRPIQSVVPIVDDISAEPSWDPLPDHTQLPESNGTFVKNFQEHPQSVLLTDSILATLDALHPDGQYAIGQDCGIYWRITDPPERGAEAPDWFYVPNVSPMLKGEIRRSYVMWQEIVSPLIALEFVSGKGDEERDKTPFSGKFWVYEQAVRIPFYGIYDVRKTSLEMYELVGGSYQRIVPNSSNRYPIDPLGVEIGLWQGLYQSVDLPWIRWWDNQGNLLLTGHEQAAQERERTTQVQQEVDRLSAKLRALGIDPAAL